MIRIKKLRNRVINILFIFFVACNSNDRLSEKKLVKNHESPYIIFNLPRNCKLKKLPEENVKIGNLYTLISPYMLYFGEDSLMFFENITQNYTCLSYFSNKFERGFSPYIYGPYKKNGAERNFFYDLDSDYEKTEKVYTRFYSQKDLDFIFFGKKQSFLDLGFGDKDIFFMTGISIPSYYTSTISYLFFTSDPKAELQTEFLESIFEHIELNDTTWSNCSGEVWANIFLERRVQVSLKNYDKMSSKCKEAVYDSIYFNMFSEKCRSKIDSIKNHLVGTFPNFRGKLSPFKYEIKDRRLSPISR